MKKLLPIFLLALVGMCSCKSDTKTTATDTAPLPEPAITQNKYELIPFKPSTAYDDASIEDVMYSAGKFKFQVSGTDYELGAQTPDAPQKMCANSSKGQHIHLIIDDAPYSAQYTDEFDYEIEDGEHYMLAFLSRSYHESIKTDKAHVAKEVMIKDNSIVDARDIATPMLFYSRPKGTYVGKAETEKVMLDFYLNNVSIGTSQKVIATINGEKHEITKWQPYYIKGLPMGENTISLMLVDNEGYMTNSPLNPVVRKFTLKADPTES